MVYRYGFNGKENDNEVKGEGMQLDYGFRIYDPRVGRFLSVDPLSVKFPFYTPYQFASNSPVASVDLDGAESVIAIQGTNTYKVQPKIQSTTDHTVSKMVVQSQMVTNIVNWLVPQLKIPDAKGSYLTGDEKKTVITETVRDFLSFNFSESLSTNFDGSKLRTITANADLNYNLVFGDKKSEMVENVKSSFEIMKPAYDAFKDASNLVPRWLDNSIEGAGYAIKASNGQYKDLTMDAVGVVAKNLVERGVNQAVQAGLLKTTATVIAPRLLSTAANVLIPLDAGGPTTTDT